MSIVLSAFGLMYAEDQMQLEEQKMQSSLELSHKDQEATQALATLESKKKDEELDTCPIKKADKSDVSEEEDEDYEDYEDYDFDDEEDEDWDEDDDYEDEDED